MSIFIIAFSIIRLVFLRFFIELTFPFFPSANSINYSMLDDIYRDNLPSALWGWGNFDGNHYIGIAMRGYGGYEHPFFPLYPRLIKFVADLGIQPLLAAELISFSAKLLFLLVAIKLLALDGKKKLTLLFATVIILFPTAFYYSAAYNDSLFLLLATLTIYLARKKRWVVASIMAAVATLTRLNGLVLAIFIVAEYLLYRKINTPKIYFVFLIPLAFIGYLLYVHLNFGSWQLVFSDMSVWGQEKMVFPLQTFWRYFKILILYPNFTPAYFTAALETGFVFGYIFLLIRFLGRIRASYWFLMLFSILLPGLTGTFQGMPRYGLHLYPFFLMLTMFISKWKTKSKVVYFIISAVLLLLLSTMFVHGYFIA